MNKKHEGPIPLDGDITPITKQPVPQVQAARWHEMTVAELYEQKSILDNRLMIANQMANYPLMQQVQSGIYQLLSVIQSKSATDEDINLL